MADQGLYDKSTTGARQTGDFIRVNRAYAPNPLGRADYKITAENFLASEQADIAQNAADIAQNASDISDLQDIISRNKRLATGNFTFTLDPYSLMGKVRCLPTVSGSIKIGTTLGGDEIYPVTTLTAGQIFEIDTFSSDMFAGAGSKTIYFTITGTVYITINYEKNLFLTA